MRLIFKQKAFSWFDSYEVYDEYGNVLYTVEGRMSWGKKLQISNASGEHIATIKRKVLAFTPTFEMYVGEERVGSVKKEISIFKPAFYVDCNGWEVEGNFLEWNYEIKDKEAVVATLKKKIMSWSDVYVIDVEDAYDAVTVLMVALAIDAEKDSRNY